MDKEILLTQAQLNKIEKGLNNRLGGSYFHRSSVTYITVNGKEVIDTVVVDVSQMPQAATSDVDNTPTGKQIVDGTQLKMHLQRLNPNYLTYLKKKFSNVDLKTWLANNWLDKGTTTVHDPSK